MQKNKNIYFLLPAVIGVWGYVIFRIIDFSSEEPTTGAYISTKVPGFRAGSKEKERYILKLDYPDPFLKNLKPVTRPTVPVNNQRNKRPPVRQVKKENPIWKSIRYQGFVENPKDHDRLALLVINGKKKLMHERDSFASVTVKTIYQDSVSLTYQGKEQKTIGISGKQQNISQQGQRNENSFSSRNRRRDGRY